ncbi:MAG: hypothetical protein LBB23_01075 [Rickettsiales bacterium]|jgi:ABC-type transporter Mla subunit MlaD|nr:hypothetical protein [Rickettsiales bacterium]
MLFGKGKLKMNPMFILVSVVAVILCATLIFAIFAMVRSSKTSRNLARILAEPSLVKMDELRNLVSGLTSSHLAAMSTAVNKMSQAIELQTTRAQQIGDTLDRENVRLVQTANAAAERLTGITTLLDARLTQFYKVVNSDQWKNLAESSHEFNENVGNLMSRAEELSIDISDRVSGVRQVVAEWSDETAKLSSALSANLEGNTVQMNSFAVESDAASKRLSALLDDTAEKFARVKSESSGLEELLGRNANLVDAHLEKISSVARESKHILDQQLGAIINTASAAGSQVRLTESSIDKQQQILERSVQTLMEHTSDAEGMVKGLSAQITGLTGRLQNEVREMIADMLGGLQKVSDQANGTLAETGNATTKFSENVSAMSQGIAGAFTDLEIMGGKIAQQSAGMIDMAQELVARLNPLQDTIAKYTGLLPKITEGSVAVSDKLSQDIEAFDAKLKSLSTAAEESILGVANSSLKLEKLTEQSRQMMMELLTDYSKALSKMESLSGGMEGARASISQPSNNQSLPGLTGQSRPNETPFMSRAGAILEKLNEISVDLVRAANTPVPDQVWDRYNEGDKGVFAKWFAKIVKGADTKKLQILWRSDAAFRGSATQFMRGFHKMLLDAATDPNKDAIQQTLLKTDVGQLYLALRELVG